MSAWWVPPTFRGYRTSWLAADGLAGLTLVAVALPSQMATARLANLAPVVGLYAFIVGSLLYAIIGTKRHLAVGADSTIAPILATGAAAVAVVGSTRFTTTMAFASLIVGALLVIIGLLRLGWISQFLSTPVITGVLAGIAVEIIVGQVHVVLGITGDDTTTIGRIRRVLSQTGHINWWTAGHRVRRPGRDNHRGSAGSADTRRPDRTDRIRCSR